MDEADTVMYDLQLATLVQKANPKASKPTQPKAQKKVDDDDKTAKKAKPAKAKADEPDPGKVTKKTKAAKDKGGKDDGPSTKKPKTKADLMNLLASLKKGDGAAPADPDDDSNFDDPEEDDSHDDDE